MNDWGALAGASSELNARVWPAGTAGPFEALSHAGIAGAVDAAAGRSAVVWLVAVAAGARVPATAEEALRLVAPARVAGAERAEPLRGAGLF